jgi:hypothetical protein
MMRLCCRIRGTRSVTGWLQTPGLGRGGDRAELQAGFRPRLGLRVPPPLRKNKHLLTLPLPVLLHTTEKILKRRLS